MNTAIYSMLKDILFDSICIGVATALVIEYVPNDIDITSQIVIFFIICAPLRLIMEKPVALIKLLIFGRTDQSSELIQLMDRASQIQQKIDDKRKMITKIMDDVESSLEKQEINEWEYCKIAKSLSDCWQSLDQEESNLAATILRLSSIE